MITRVGMRSHHHYRLPTVRITLIRNRALRPEVYERGGNRDLWKVVASLAVKHQNPGGSDPWDLG